MCSYISWTHRHCQASHIIAVTAIVAACNTSYAVGTFSLMSVGQRAFVLHRLVCMQQCKSKWHVTFSYANEIDRLQRVLCMSTCFHRVYLAWGMCRGLALLNNIGVVSASHDQTLRVWTFQGDCIAELVGHTALVYNAACSDDGGLIASASEDNTVCTWRPDGQCLQTIEHPGTVCSLAFLRQHRKRKEKKRLRLSASI